MKKLLFVFAIVTIASIECFGYTSYGFVDSPEFPYGYQNAKTYDLTGERVVSYHLYVHYIGACSISCPAGSDQVSSTTTLINKYGGFEGDMGEYGTLYMSACNLAQYGGYAHVTANWY